MVNWKITAIVFIILFSVLLIFNIWSVAYVLSEEDAINDCYYNVCEEYPNAWYEAGLCACYDVDEYGEDIIVKTKYIK